MGRQSEEAGRIFAPIEGTMREAGSVTLRLEPMWDKRRGQPEFDAFLAEMSAAAK